MSKADPQYSRDGWWWWNGYTWKRLKRPFQGLYRIRQPSRPGWWTPGTRTIGLLGGIGIWVAALLIGGLALIVALKIAAG